jgi:hypothetical protein
MSYAQAVKWGRKHPRGTKQPMLMSAGSGFWLARSWLEGNWWPYMEACKAAGVEHIGCEAFYRATTRRTHIPRQLPDYVAMTVAGTLA